MKKLLIPLFVLIGISLAAQDFEYIPEEYQAIFDRLKNRIVTEDEGKIYLDPIEQVPIIPTEFSMQADGNWAYDYMNVGKYSDLIFERAQRSVVVFIFDTAGEFDHQDLQEANWPEKGRVFNRRNPEDLNGHSTHVAGIIAGLSQNYNIGIAEALVRRGLLRIIPYKVLNADGAGFNSDIINAIKVANEEAQDLISKGYFVIYNFSLGGASVNSSFNTYLGQAEDAGVFVVGAAGNSGVEFVHTPANGPSAHAIGSIDPSGKRSGFSTYGKELYNAAPGARIFSTWLNGDYRELSGTSMATPCVAGIVAIIASIHESATNRQISHFLRRHGLDLQEVGWDKETGYGAGIVSEWWDKDPAKEVDKGNGNPDTPNFDPEPEDPEEPGEEFGDERRRITYILEDEYTLHWKQMPETAYHSARVNMCVSFSSKLKVGPASSLLREATEEFFKASGIWVTQGGDLHDAGIWARHFYERDLAEIGMDIEVVNMVVSDDKNVIIQVGNRSKLTEGIKKIFNPEIRAIKYDDDGKSKVLKE